MNISNDHTQQELYVLTSEFSSTSDGSGAS